jgi:hypothetical protein
MTKGFLSSSGAYIRFLILFLILINKSWAQVLPSSFGVHHKPSEASVNYALNFDGSNDHLVTNGGTISSAWSAEVWFKKASNQGGHNFTNNANSNNSGTWSLRLGQWNNTNKVGITKYGVRDYYINDSKADLDIGKWEHVSWTYESNLVTVYVNGESLGTTFSRGPLANGAILYWNIIGKSPSHSLHGEIDEVRIWNDVRTLTEIKDNMFKELNGNENGLIAYYKMTEGSGTTVTDNSSNSNNGTISGASWVTSNAPIGNLFTSYQTDIEGLWDHSGTSESEASDGLSMSVSSTLAEANFVVFGNNNDDTGTTSSSLSGISKRSKREWNFDEQGTVTADVKIDISNATGYSGSISAASNYKLLFKTCEFCAFSEVETGNSASGDIITFSSVAIQDGIYSIASADSNL